MAVHQQSLKKQFTQIDYWIHENIIRTSAGRLPIWKLRYGVRRCASRRSAKPWAWGGVAYHKGDMHAAIGALLEDSRLVI